MPKTKQQRSRGQRHETAPQPENFSLPTTRAGVRVKAGKATVAQDEDKNIDINVDAQSSTSVLKADQKDRRTGSCEVIYDLETTGLDVKSVHITQIAAVAGDGRSFNRYIIPPVPIPQHVTDLTGLAVIEGHMQYQGRQVETVSLKSALKDFIKFLLDCGTNVTLFGHYIEKFDNPILLRHIRQEGLMTEFKSATIGFIDTLPLLKEVYPGRLSYKQKDLVIDILDTSYGAHNALNDVKALQNLLKCREPSEKQRSNHFSVFKF